MRHKLRRSIMRRFAAVLGVTLLASAMIWFVAAHHFATLAPAAPPEAQVNIAEPSESFAMAERPTSRSSWLSRRNNGGESPLENVDRARAGLAGRGSPTPSRLAPVGTRSRDGIASVPNWICPFLRKPDKDSCTDHAKCTAETLSCLTIEVCARWIVSSQDPEARFTLLPYHDEQLADYPLSSPATVVATSVGDLGYCCRAVVHAAFHIATHDHRSLLTPFGPVSADPTAVRRDDRRPNHRAIGTQREEDVLHRELCLRG